MAIVFPLGSTLASAFYFRQQKNWLESCPLKYRPFYYQRGADYIFVFPIHQNI